MPPRAYEIVPLVERTPAWWEWRRRGIGSADAAIILGAKRGKTPEDLLEEKRRAHRDTARSFEQARSAKSERHAREHYCALVGFRVNPACVQSLARPWQRASLDGLSANGEHAVEIKCGRAAYDAAAARRRPAPHHVPQLQHILAVTGLSVVDYFCHRPCHPAIRLEVRRDEACIARLLAAEEIFWRRLAAS